MRPAQPALAASGMIGNRSSGRFFEQNDIDVVEFVQHLIHYLKTGLDTGDVVIESEGN